MFPFDLSAPFPSELAFATENLNVFMTSKFLFRGLGIRGSKSSFWLWLRLSEHKSFVECEVFFNSNSSQGCTLSPTHLPRFGRERVVSINTANYPAPPTRVPIFALKLKTEILAKESNIGSRDATEPCLHLNGQSYAGIGRERFMIG
jgi:hypothetical protein